MTTRRRIAVSIAALFLALVLVLVLVPVFFRAPIEARAKRAASESVDATIDWRKLDLSLIRTFPNLSLQLRDLTVVGKGRFAHDTLVAIPQFRFVFDIGSVLRHWRGHGPLVVREIAVEKPRTRLIMTKDGQANWSIFKKSENRKPSDLQINLQRLAIDDGMTWLRFADVPYLNGVRTNFHAQLEVNSATNTYTLRQNELQLNDLVLRAEGKVTSGDKVDVDLRLSAPRTDFKEILSLVPAIYAHDFAKLRTSGTMTASAAVRGAFAGNSLPAFLVKAAVQNGSFQYTDLPLPARDINLSMTVANPGGDVDNTVVNVSRFHFVLGSDAMDGSLSLRTPKSDPDVALQLAGRIDLANVPRTIKLDSVKQLSGVVDANARVRAKRSDIDARNYDRIGAAGDIAIRGMAVNAAAMRQPLRIDDALLHLTPQRAELTSFRGVVGSSDLTMNGSLDNLIGFVLRKEVLRGTVTASSHRFNLDEWRSDDELKAIEVPGNLDFDFTANADTVKYGLLTLLNARGKVRIKDRRATLDDFSMQTLGGGMKVTGYYETIDTIHPGFDVALDFNEVNIPDAFRELKTVQLFAPVAKYAQGAFSAHMRVNGALGKDMMPVYPNLSALGSLVTNGLVLKDFPPLNKIADATRLQLLRNPGFIDVKSSFSMQNGRLSVKPFDVRTGSLTMNVVGSNGIDQTIDYAVRLNMPNANLGTVKLGGTITNPTVKLDLADAFLEQAQKQALMIRAEADSLAEKLRREAYLQADSLEARATGLKRIAAKLAADKIRKEADKKAEDVKREAASRADALLLSARNRAGGAEPRSQH